MMMLVIYSKRETRLNLLDFQVVEVFSKIQKIILPQNLLSPADSRVIVLEVLVFPISMLTILLTRIMQQLRILKI